MEFNKSDLISDLNLYMYTYAKEYTKKASEEFVKVAKETIIDTFYNAYSPIYYDRTYDLMDNSYVSYFHDNGTHMYGGVIINDDNMSDYMNSWSGTTTYTSSADVIQWTWMWGYHGRNKNGPIQTPSPLLDLAIKLEDEIMPQLQESASNVAKSQKYTVLQF